MDTKKFEILEEFVKEFNTGKNRYYKCKCNCGRIFESSKRQVDTGKTKSCNKKGCHRAVIEMIGKKFGRLTVLSHHSRKDGYLCRCDCGNTSIVRTFALKTSQNISCGCFSKEAVALRNYKGPGKSALNAIYTNYKRCAAKRGYDFELSKLEFETLIKQKCYYCGKEGSMNWKWNRKIIIENDYTYNGVDRVNNSLGYCPSNCVSCCDICNNAKSTLSIKEWKEWIIRVYNGFIQKDSCELDRM